MILESIINFKVGKQVRHNEDNFCYKNKCSYHQHGKDKIGEVVKIEDNIIYVRWPGAKQSKIKKYIYVYLRIHGE